MNTATPKQFLEVARKTILHHTLEQFFTFDINAHIIVVLPKDRIPDWREIIHKYKVKIPHTIVEGGAERFFSVKNALDSIDIEEAIVSIHDGVRPLVSHKTISNCIETAAKYNAAIPVVELKESIRFVDNDLHYSLDRSKYRLVQTPQCFNLQLIKRAYEQDYLAEFTDDASVFEKVGGVISLIEGNPENIKITTPSDLIFADTLLKK